MPDVRTHEPDEHDNAYAGLLVNDAHWAFGTDFEDRWPAWTPRCPTASTPRRWRPTA